MTKVIYSVILIGKIEQRCVLLNGMLQSLRLKYCVKTIGIEKLMRNNDLFEHKCIQNTKKLCKYRGKCDNQQQLKYILEAAMGSTPEGFTDNNPISPITQTACKEPSARKLLCLFTNILDVKNKTAICRVRSAELNLKAIKAVTTPKQITQNRKVKSKIDDQI